MKHPYFEPPSFKMKDYIRFLEWQEARDEVRSKKREENKKRDYPKEHRFTFTEGMLLAFVFQYVFGPSISAALKAYGVQ